MTKKKASKKKPSKRAEIVAKKMRPAKTLVPATPEDAPKPAPADPSTKRPHSSSAAKRPDREAGADEADKSEKSGVDAPNKAGRGKSKMSSADALPGMTDAMAMPKGGLPERVLEAAQPLQRFAVEMQHMAHLSVVQTGEVLERLRDARSVEEVVLLQTTFMQQTFRRYTEFATRISELMTAGQVNLFQQSQTAVRSLRSMASGG